MKWVLHCGLVDEEGILVGPFPTKSCKPSVGFDLVKVEIICIITSAHNVCVVAESIRIVA